jgi:hypothetical protein
MEEDNTEYSKRKHETMRTYHRNEAIRSEYRNTRHSKNNKKTQYTRKNKKPRKLSEWEHFRARMNLPIGTSSFGIPITDDVRKENERIAREIDLRIKDNKH